LWYFYGMVSEKIMHIFKYLPVGAVQIPYVHPQYEFYEDEDGEGHEECVNEHRATDVHALIRNLQHNKIPFYYRRRNVHLAREDKHTWIMHCGVNKIPVLVRKVGKRVVFEYSNKLEQKYKQGGKYNYKSPIGKARKTRINIVEDQIQSLTNIFLQQE